MNGGVLRIVVGMLKVEVMLSAVATQLGRIASSIFLVVVLPTEPVMPMTVKLKNF